MEVMEDQAGTSGWDELLEEGATARSLSLSLSLSVLEIKQR